MFSRTKNEKKPAPSKLERRASLLSERELIRWIEAATYEQGKALTAYQRDPKEEYLIQAKSLSDEAAALLEVLLQQRQAPPPR